MGFPYMVCYPKAPLYFSISLVEHTAYLLSIPYSDLCSIYCVNSSPEHPTLASLVLTQLSDSFQDVPNLWGFVYV